MYFIFLNFSLAEGPKRLSILLSHPKPGFQETSLSRDLAIKTIQKDDLVKESEVLLMD